MKHLFPMCALLWVACTGTFEDPTQGDPRSKQPAAAPSGPNSACLSSGEAPEVGAPFKVRNTEPELVPFDMRVRRIANAIGVEVTHPMFANMYKNSLKLGDYDYANGALPDFSWNANRIAAWLNALKPVCNSAEMKAKYPALPENLPALIRAAWGHLPSAEDTADFRSAIAAADSDAAIDYESSCMAVFTAAEFVYR